MLLFSPDRLSALWPGHWIGFEAPQSTPGEKRIRLFELDPKTKDVVWQDIDLQRWTFFRPVMRGVQRLANDNTLIRESLNGRPFAVTQRDVVWNYVCPMFYPVPRLSGSI